MYKSDSAEHSAQVMESFPVVLFPLKPDDRVEKEIVRSELYRPIDDVILDDQDIDKAEVFYLTRHPYIDLDKAEKSKEVFKVTQFPIPEDLHDTDCEDLVGLVAQQQKEKSQTKQRVENEMLMMRQGLGLTDKEVRLYTATNAEGVLLDNGEIEKDDDIMCVEEQEAYSVLVMPFYKGEELFCILNQAPCIPLYAVVQIMQEIICSLSVIHGRGVAHGDVTPANILLCGALYPEDASLSSILAYLALVEFNFIDFEYARNFHDNPCLSLTGLNTDEGVFWANIMLELVDQAIDKKTSVIDGIYQSVIKREADIEDEQGSRNESKMVSTLWLDVLGLVRIMALLISRVKQEDISDDTLSIIEDTFVELIRRENRFHPEKNYSDDMAKLQRLCGKIQPCQNEISVNSSSVFVKTSLHSGEVCNENVRSFEI